MVAPKIEVNAQWDPEAKVWVAESDNVPGLITEAATLEILQKKLSVMIPEILEANGILDRELTEIPFELIAHREQRISLRH